MTSLRVLASIGASTSGRTCPGQRISINKHTRHTAPQLSVTAAWTPRKRHASRLAAASTDDRPDWVKELEESAQYDEEVAAMLRGTGGDPAQIEQRIRADMDALHARITGESASGEEAPVEVTFRQVDPFNLWVWIQLYTPPSPAEAEMLQEVANSWFMLGRLGAFNSANLQVLYAAGDAEGLSYETPDAEGLGATMHDMFPMESNGEWTRFWVDMGAADELALDVLVNALLVFSREHVGLKRVVVGGQNDDWEVPERGSPTVTMDPMQGPGEEEW